MTDYLKQLDRALTSPDTISPPTTSQLAAADVYACAAQAHALTRIANALEAIAAAAALTDIADALHRIADNNTPNSGVSIRSAIRHST